MCLPFIRRPISLFQSLLRCSFTDQHEDLGPVALGSTQQPQGAPQPSICSRSEERWTRDLQPSTGSHLVNSKREEENEALLQADLERLTQYLMLSKDERCLCAKQYSVQEDGEFALSASADLGYQAFASLTLHFILESNSTSLLELSLEDLGWRTREAFLKLPLSIAVALSGVACDVGILPRDLTWDCLTAHMQKVKDVSADLLDHEYNQQIATVLENSDSFLAVQLVVSANLTGRLLKHRGCLKDDLQMAVVSVFRK